MYLRTHGKQNKSLKDGDPMFGMNKSKGNGKRSPLKYAPLRTPGQSIQEEIDKTSEKFLDFAFVLIIATVMAGMEWSRWFFNSPPAPILFSLIAAVPWAYGLKKSSATRKRLRALRQARDGERVIGQGLERLRENGYRVLHDLVGEGFNIDHLVIGPTGVYSIETKTISKPAKGRCEITYDGQRLLINGYEPSRNPIVQAKAQANWLHGFVKEVDGKSLEVRPVVLYPGWFVKPQPRGAKVWVLNPDALQSFIKNEKVVLDGRDIQMIEQSLAAYIRNSNVTPSAP